VAVVTLGLACSCASAGGDEALANILPNPSFEEGRQAPAGWQSFGLAKQTWEMHGHEGERAVEVRGDGQTFGWWSTPLDRRIARNAVYRVSVWARALECKDQVPALVGLNLADDRPLVGAEWAYHEFYFRSPTFLPDPKFRLGLERAKGLLCFDDVRLEPAVGIHRSKGIGGGLSLGDGEKIIEGKYTAVHDLTTRHTTDVRFLDSYTAQFHDDRWVLHRYDEVVYVHAVRQLGVQGMGPIMKVSDRVRHSSGPVSPRGTSMSIEWVENDPRAGSHFLQRPVRLQLEVGRVVGALFVEICQDGRTWQTVKVIERPGHHDVDLADVSGRAYELWVRLKVWDGRGTEVTGYRYDSLVEGGRRTTATGETHYVTVVYASPNLEIGVDDLGELKPGGRSEVKLIIKNVGERVRLRCRSVIEGTAVGATYSAQPDWLAKGSRCRVHVPYEIPDQKGHVLRIIGRDETSGRLLFMLETRSEEEPCPVVVSGAEQDDADIAPASAVRHTAAD
jgi:hypothetical protein